MNMCYSGKYIKYICKYVNKSSAQTAFTVENQIDEVNISSTSAIPEV